MLKITNSIYIDEAEIQMSFIRAPGPGGQNVNKVASAVQLRFNVLHSPSFSPQVRERILAKLQNKLTREGDLIIKAYRFRTQERNKADAIERLQAYLHAAAFVAKKRKKTKPSRAAKEKRLKSKKLHAKTKLLRSEKINRE